MPEPYARAVRKVLDFAAIKSHAGAHGLNVGNPCGIQVPASENNDSIMPMGVNLLS